MAAIATTESVNQNAAWSANPHKSTFILLRDASISLKAVIRFYLVVRSLCCHSAMGAASGSWQREARRTDVRDSSRAAEQKWGSAASLLIASDMLG